LLLKPSISSSRCSLLGVSNCAESAHDVFPTSGLGGIYVNYSTQSIASELGSNNLVFQTWCCVCALLNVSMCAVTPIPTLDDRIAAWFSELCFRSYQPSQSHPGLFFIQSISSLANRKYRVASYAQLTVSLYAVCEAQDRGAGLTFAHTRASSHHASDDPIPAHHSYTPSLSKKHFIQPQVFINNLAIIVTSLQVDMVARG
jgi:hypothetical protein